MSGLKEWEDEEEIYSEKRIFKRFKDKGNFDIYGQRMDISYVAPQDGLTAKWRITIKADKDAQTFQSDNLEVIENIKKRLINDILRGYGHGRRY